MQGFQKQTGLIDISDILFICFNLVIIATTRSAFTKVRYKFHKVHATAAVKVKGSKESVTVRPLHLSCLSRGEEIPQPLLVNRPSIVDTNLVEPVCKGWRSDPLTLIISAIRGGNFALNIGSFLAIRCM
jgi:hypothetical protein